MPLLFLGVISVAGQVASAVTVTDEDGNVYPILVMEDYEWMAENLRTTTYSDGTEIPNVLENGSWSNSRTGAFCWYNNEAANAELHGALYNWHAVATGKLCPEGWRVPSDEEWSYLEAYADSRHGRGEAVWKEPGLRGHDVGRRLKTATGWMSDGDGIDSIQFSARPGGERLSRDGRFILGGANGFFWTSTEDGESNAWYRSLIYAFDTVVRDSHPKGFGFSVRCLREK